MSMIGCYCRLSKAKLAALKKNPSSVVAFLTTEDDPTRHIDIDKAWDAIHFLLNGQKGEGSGPLHDAVLGGEVLAQDIFFAYGPVRCLTPSDVKKTVQALADVPADELLKRFDAELLNDKEIYPRAWTGKKQDLEYIKNNYLRLVEFFGIAADRGEAMLLYIN